MSSINEWGKLKKVIVGVADHARIPQPDISLRTVNFADITNDKEIKTGIYPPRVIEEANEDLEILCNFLRSENVEVLRPQRTDCNYYNYCPRDSVLTYKDKSYPTPMPLRARKDEWKAMQEHLSNRVIYDYEHPDELYNIKCVGNASQLALNETHPAFDAANIIKANEHLLYLVSNSGNMKGAELLQELVGKDVHVHLLKDVYSYMHIDSTIAFLREGLLLANPSRIKNKDDLPEPFRSWDIVWCPEPVDIGHYPGWCNASQWVNVNLFSINQNLVVLEERQEPTRKELEKHGIECAMLPMRHARTLGGCFHCVTLDLERNVV